MNRKFPTIPSSTRIHSTVFRSRLVAAGVALSSLVVALPAAAQDPAPLAPSASAPTQAAHSNGVPAVATENKSSDHGPRKGEFGLSLGLPAGGGPTFGMSYGVAPRASLRLDLGLDVNSVTPQAQPGPLGATAAPDKTVLLGFSIDAGYRMYLWQSGSLHAYVQPGIFYSKRAERGDFGALSTVSAVGGVGAEYFFLDQLSVSGATGLSLTLSNDFKDVRLNTGTTALYANFYW